MYALGYRTERLPELLYVDLFVFPDGCRQQLDYVSYRIPSPSRSKAEQVVNASK